ncbi:glutaredoxin 3 [Acidithiobacillus sp. AMEEHan]|uniref:glutaredoxin 3 n=1 Tax=Acidithiobacillus sp. AMEEHan TaxID=2994951 RepID=UPI0027E440EF|nr:glutaredoxin 3 [Acidithiobacillus sp. AMEEHan]
MAEVIVYATHACGYCRRALALLQQKHVVAQIIWVDQEPQRRAEMIQLAAGRRTVPQIFIAQRHIGGCDDLFALERRGELDSLLRN